MEITFRSFSHFRVFDLCLSNQFVDLPVSRWGRRVLLLREMPRTILQHRKSRAELAWITQNARSEQMRLSQSAMLRRIGQELAWAPSQRSFGHSGGSTTMRPAVNMDGAFRPQW